MYWHARKLRIKENIVNLDPEITESTSHWLAAVQLPAPSAPGRPNPKSLSQSQIYPSLLIFLSFVLVTFTRSTVTQTMHHTDQTRAPCRHSLCPPPNRTD